MALPLADARPTLGTPQIPAPRTFLDQVAHALPADDDLLLIGDGEVVEHFADHIRTDDANHGRERRIQIERIGPITERQLLARIRTFAGSPAKRYLPR